MTAIHAERAAYEFQVAEMPLERKNAALRAAVEARLFGKASDDEHPVMADPEDESGDEPDPLHERKAMPDPLRTFIQKRQHPSTTAFLALLDEVAEMHRTKSHDYGSADDPLANIRNGAEFVGIEPWRASMVRLSDKVTRLASYNRTGRLNHESVEDSLLDLASYALLTLLLFREDAPAD